MREVVVALQSALVLWLHGFVAIPPHTAEGVLPPYSGSVSADECRSPWRATVFDLVERFGTTPRRIELLRSLLLLRARLYEVGVVQGWQWIDGSFVEQKEEFFGIDPGDIDVVTFADFSGLDRKDAVVRKALAGRVPGCDAYIIDLARFGSEPAEATRWVQYWYGLFSHQKGTNSWKGFVEIPLSPGIDGVVGRTLDANGGPHETH